jgi:hypothetical protein
MNEEALGKLVHDVNSKCSSLKSAAALLKNASDEERKEFLTLMRDQAKSLLAALEKVE